MERPVSFAAEDIRDEKVGGQYTVNYLSLMYSTRSKFCGLSRPLNVMTLFSASTWLRTANPDISRTIPFRPTLSVRPSLPPPSGSITQDGKVSRSFSGLAKVCVLLVASANGPSLIPCFSTPALNESKVEVRIQFKDVAQGIFKDIARNELVIRIQPSEAIYLKMNTKLPGLYTRAMPTEMDLTYKRRFTDTKIPEAYESLILDALKGDHSNFVRDDELDVAWKVSSS
jgi:hypothetical protein